MIRVAILSPDIKLRHLFAPALGPGFHVTVESNPQAIRQLAVQNLCDVLVVDFESNEGASEQQLAFFDQLRDSQVPVLVMTDDDRRSTVFELLQRGVYDYFRKPPDIPELKIILRRAHEHASVKKELRAVQQQLRGSSGCDQLIGSSLRSRVVYDLIHRVANLNTFVLITGESGTGKELIARAIHNLSERAKRPFVAVSCGAIPETLIESELFGHEKGAFTGTMAARAGYMEQAGDGTLFLDEIGELSLHTQVKLLRALQQREFSRLGSGRLLPLRARVLFATHRDLHRMVQEGKFREDLYYRVNVMRIHSPALRERSDDIVALAEHFVRKYSEICQKRIEAIQPNAMTLLLAHSWPGNVRELENVIQRALILAEGDTLSVEDLPASLQRPELLETAAISAPGSFEEQLRTYKVRLANQAIESCNGNKTMAARSLSISRAYLHRLIRENGDEQEREWTAEAAG